VPGASLYKVPQYGQVALPPCDKSRKTRGCDDHSGIVGFGQCAGKSLACSSTTAVAEVAEVAAAGEAGEAGELACIMFSGD
jgi:hypothetical protein